MFPALPADNRLDQLAATSICRGELDLGNSARRIFLSYLSSLCGVQASSALARRSGKTMPTLLTHVAGVISGGAQEQMIGPNARRVVTVVKYPMPVGNRASMKFPREAVGHATEALASNLPVSPTSPRARPKPTAIRLFYIAPEILLHRLRPNMGAASAGAATSHNSLPFNLGDTPTEPLAAGRAYECDPWASWSKCSLRVAHARPPLPMTQYTPERRPEQGD
jgi:hypothetical protein